MKWLGTRLRERGIMGMNERNALFIMNHNPRRLYPLVDDKLQTKKLAQAAGIAVPELYGVIAYEHQVPEFLQMTERHPSFVIKPAQGAGGDGILVIRGRRRNNFIRANGSLISVEEIEHHISNILSGMFSLGGVSDKALIEYCVRFDPIFEGVTFQGVPDIRTLVFRGVPVSAMARLPTPSDAGECRLRENRR